ncbi:MAG: rod shape-determining protein RodA [Candidatus Levybacteria bacterium]|nr:rod shape-determining protein RodA [Candidatus Levybacteria bacterium]
MKLANFSSIDWPLMISVAVIIVFSLVSLFSIDASLFRSQFVFLIISLVAFLFFTQFNYSILRYYWVPIYIASLLILIAVLFLGIESRGSVRWFELFGIRLQFSEILKPFLALSLAGYLTNLQSFSFRSFLVSLILLAPLVLLIFLQPDLGNALIYVFVVLSALLIYGFPLRWFLAGFVIWLMSLPFFWLILHDYQKQRVLTFINPARDPLGTSYNAIQAVIAIGSGMFLGRGLGQGTQAGLRFLPERHTDFIFATISESLGFIGSAIVIIAFAFLFYRLFNVIRNSEDDFSKNFSILAFLIIFVHFVINVGMNLGIVPIVGVTLPFVSYGGSSLLSNFILLGLLFAVSRGKRREVLEIH